MDSRLRALQRAYQADPVGTNLTALMQEYARAGQIPEGDIEALSMVNTYPDWHRQFNRGDAQTLLELGYPMGVYFHLKIKMNNSEALRAGVVFPSLTQIAGMIHRGFIRKTENLETQLRNAGAGGWTNPVDSIDGYDVSPGNSSARAVQPDGRFLYQHNIDQVVPQLLAIPADLQDTILRYSSIIAPPVVKKGVTTATYRIFIPATELERVYWPQFITSQGMSRSTVRQRAKSMVDWGTKNQFQILQAALFGNIGNWILQLDELENSILAAPAKLGVNLLLGLSCYWHFRTQSWLV